MGFHGVFMPFYDVSGKLAEGAALTIASLVSKFGSTMNNLDRKSLCHNYHSLVAFTILALHASLNSVTRRPWL
jgi:hypothetical protein